MSMQIFLVIILAASLPGISQQDNVTICQLQHCDVLNKPWSDVFQLCNAVTGTFRGPCCLNGNFPIGADLSQCATSSLLIAEEDQNHILLLNLTDSNISCTDNMIARLPNLQRVDLPENCVNCPSPLNAVNVSKPNICVTNEYISETCNATCPENAECSKVANGLEHCVCAKGFHGYRCLKKKGFPSITIFSTLSSLTAVLSGFVWFTQRRHVIKI